MNYSAPGLTALIRHIVCYSFAVLTLVACGGGIYGTGDGNEIIVSNTSDNSVGDGSANESTNGMIDSGVSRLQYFPAISIGNTGTDSLTPADAINLPSTSANPMLTDTLNTQLSHYQQVTNRLLIDLLLLEHELGNTLPDCETSGLCTTIPATIAVSASAAGVNPTGARDEDQFSFSDIRYVKSDEGYFDHQLSYTRDNGTAVYLQWDNTKTLQSLYVDSAGRYVHSLSDQQESTLVFRMLAKNTGTIVQAIVNEQIDGSSLIEADLGNWYLRASTDAQSSVIYAQSLIDQTNRREAVSFANTESMVETCERSNCVWHSQTGQSSPLFSNTAETVGNFSQTLSTGVALNLPSGTSRFVIAETEDLQSTLAQQSIVCGGVLIAEGSRQFCWQPLPLTADTLYLFAETLSDTLPAYQLLAQ